MFRHERRENLTIYSRHAIFYFNLIVYLIVYTYTHTHTHIYTWKNRFDRLDGKGRKSRNRWFRIQSSYFQRARRDRRTDRSFHPAGDNALNRQSDRRLTPPCRVNTRSLFLFRLPILLPLPLLVSLDNYSRLREISHAHSFARLFKGRLH